MASQDNIIFSSDPIICLQYLSQKNAVWFEMETMEAAHGYSHVVLFTQYTACTMYSRHYLLLLLMYTCNPGTVVTGPTQLTSIFGFYL